MNLVYQVCFTVLLFAPCALVFSMVAERYQQFNAAEGLRHVAEMCVSVGAVGLFWYISNEIVWRLL